MPPIGIMQLASWLENSGIRCNCTTGPLRAADNRRKCGNRAGHRSANGRFFGNHVRLHGCLRNRRHHSRAPAGYPDRLRKCPCFLTRRPILENFRKSIAWSSARVKGDARTGRRQAAGRYRQPDLAQRAGRIIVNPRRDRIVDLDELPFPAYEKLAGFPHDYHLPLFAYERSMARR